MSIFTPLKLAGLACMGVGGTCSVVYAGSSLLSDFSTLESDDDSVIQNINDKFGARLISGNSGKSSRIWSERLKKLRGDKDKVLDGELDLELEKIKKNEGGNKTERDLQDWCESAKIKPSEDEDSKLIVRGVEDYCTYMIIDQASSRVISKSKKDKEEIWKPVNKRLIDYKGFLSDDMKEIQKKVKDENSKDLKEWCFASYDKPFKDKNDQLYKDVSLFCVEVKKPSQPRGAAKSEDTKSPTVPNVRGVSADENTVAS